jgi:gluconate kinase
MRFVLLEGTRELIAARLAARKGHFMPPALLDSQLATLELSDDLLRVSIDQEPDEIVREIVEKLHGAA